MRLKNLRLKLKRLSLKRFLIRNVKRKSRKVENGKRAGWMNGVSHGYRVVKLGQTWAKTPTRTIDFDPVVVQREQTEDCEFWFFGVFDDQVIAQEITKTMQSNFFNKLSQQSNSNMGKKCKEAMKRAHLKARSKVIERDEGDAAAWESGSASAMVINGEKLVMANTGGYTAVLCRDGEAYQICRKRQHPTAPKWPLALFSGALRVPKFQKIFCDARTKSSKSSEVIVGSEIIDSETEFVILASTGVWEVMKQQEAVNLIRHIENAQAAAECLATEALIRKTKSIVSCLVIRFY